MYAVTFYVSMFGCSFDFLSFAFMDIIARFIVSILDALLVTSIYKCPTKDKLSFYLGLSFD